MTEVFRILALAVFMALVLLTYTWFKRFVVPVRYNVVEPEPRKQHLSGMRLVSLNQARQLAPETTDPLCLWGGVPIPPVQGLGGFLVLGSPGSGKSITISMLLRDIHQRAGRILVFDPKLEYLGLLLGELGYSHDDIEVLHPRIEGTSCWDIAADYGDATARSSLARSLIPDRPSDHNEHFRISAQIWVENLTEMLDAHCKGKWTLRDLVVASNTRKYLERVMRLDPVGTVELESFEDAGYEGRSVLNTLKMQLRNYGVVANAWDRAWHEGRRFSLTRWVNGEGPRIVVLGFDENNSSVLSPICRAFFERAAQLLLDSTQPAHEHEPRTWLFLDEVHYLRPGEELTKILNVGRTNGVTMVAGQQYIETLYPRQPHAIDDAKTFFAAFRNRAYLSPGLSATTAQFMSESLGDQTVLERRDGWGENEKGLPRANASYGETNEPIRRPGDFQALKAANGGRGAFHGYYSTEFAVWEAGVPKKVWPGRWKAPFDVVTDAANAKLAWSTEDEKRLFGFEQDEDNGPPLGEAHF